MVTENIDFTVEGETIGCGDSELMSMIDERRNDLRLRKRQFDINSGGAGDGGDYLDFTVARLSYAFAKEKYFALLREASRRGLL